MLLSLIVLQEECGRVGHGVTLTQLALLAKAKRKPAHGGALCRELDEALSRFTDGIRRQRCLSALLVSGTDLLDRGLQG